MPPKKDASAPISVKPNALKGKSVIVTGEIDGYSRKAAEAILVNAGATIEKSLNKKVQLVVLGADAGPKKLEKIESLGIEIQEWDELIDEIKADGDAGPAGDDDDDEDEDDGEEEEEVEEKPKPKAKAKAAPKPKANTKAKAAPAPKPAAKASASSGDSDLDGKTVIITGSIPGMTRPAAQKLIEGAGATFAKSLNKQVELVILGSDPGPDKLAKIEDMGVETIAWSDLAGKLGVEAKPEKKAPSVSTGDAPDSVDGLTLIITGNIEGMTHPAAQKLLEAEGAKFAKSLNKSVELVVLGAKPGPDKLAKISDLGIETCAFEDLAEKLGLDVDAPPKKKAKKT